MFAENIGVDTFGANINRLAQVEAETGGVEQGARAKYSAGG